MNCTSEKLKEIAKELIVEESVGLDCTLSKPQFSSSGGFFSFTSCVLPNGDQFVFDGDTHVETSIRFVWCLRLDWEGKLIGEIEVDREHLLSPEIAPKESIKAPDGFTFRPIDCLGAWGDGSTVEDSDLTFDCWREVIEAYA